MQLVSYTFAAAMIPIQPHLNAILAHGIGSSYWATAISTGFAFACILFVIAVAGLGKISTRTLSTVSWWVIIAGNVGAIFVLSGTDIAPVTGGLVFFACIVAGQLIGLTIADKFGAFGLAVRAIRMGRLAGNSPVNFRTIFEGRG